MAASCSKSTQGSVRDPDGDSVELESGASQAPQRLARTAGPRPARKKRRADKKTKKTDPQKLDEKSKSKHCKNNNNEDVEDVEDNEGLKKNSDENNKFDEENDTSEDDNSLKMKRGLARAAASSAKRVTGNMGTSNDDRVKLCAKCGRTMEMRKKWKDNWEEVKFCSKKCRSTKLRPLDRQMEAEILRLLETRAAASTICPSEVPRRLGLENWRDEMEAARQAVRRLAARGIVQVRQRGQIVDPYSFRGPIRVSRGDEFRADLGSLDDEDI